MLCTTVTLSTIPSNNVSYIPEIPLHHHCSMLSLLTRFFIPRTPTHHHFSLLLLLLSFSISICKHMQPRRACLQNHDLHREPAQVTGNQIFGSITTRICWLLPRDEAFQHAVYVQLFPSGCSHDCTMYLILHHPILYLIIKRKNFKSFFFVHVLLTTGSRELLPYRLIRP